MTLAYFAFSTVSHAALANIETTYGVVMPKPQYFPYPDVQMGGDGGNYPRGMPVAIWDWGFISKTAFGLWRTACPYASVDCWLRTPLEPLGWNDSSKYGYFTGKMNFPVPGSFEISGGKVYPFRLTFSMLVQYTPA